MKTLILSLFIGASCLLSPPSWGNTCAAWTKWAEDLCIPQTYIEEYDPGDCVQSELRRALSENPELRDLCKIECGHATYAYWLTSCTKPLRLVDR